MEWFLKTTLKGMCFLLTIIFIVFGVIYLAVRYPVETINGIVIVVFLLVSFAAGLILEEER